MTLPSMQERVAKNVWLREALVVQLLQGHPNVVTVIDIFRKGDYSGLLVMPLLKPYTRFGPLPRVTLRTRMQQLLQVLPENRLLSRGVALTPSSLLPSCSRLQGLAWIHSKGFVHRDICPRNLMLHPEDGRVVIIDFGSACKQLLLQL
jgi:serine/threonine protein kinase